MIPPMASIATLTVDNTDATAETPALRLLALLEVIAGQDTTFTLQGLAEETDTPKPTLHRMLQQLEGAQT